jgi:hypothetical protein
MHKVVIAFAASVGNLLLVLSAGCSASNTGSTEPRPTNTGHDGGGGANDNGSQPPPPVDDGGGAPPPGPTPGRRRLERKSVRVHPGRHRGVRRQPRDRHASELHGRRNRRRGRHGLLLHAGAHHAARSAEPGRFVQRRLDATRWQHAVSLPGVHVFRAERHCGSLRKSISPPSTPWTDYPLAYTFAGQSIPGYTWFPSGQGTAQVGDIHVYQSTYQGDPGHIMIVAAVVDSTHFRLAEANELNSDGTEANTDTGVVSNTRIDSLDNPLLAGWFRLTGTPGDD